METTTNEERVDFLTETYDISDNCAKALLLSEMGFSHSGIASKLGLASSTVQSYLNELEEKIGQGVTESVPKSVRYPTYPGDTPKSEVPYSADHIEVRDSMEDRDVPVNKGCDFEDIPTELINI